MEARSRCHLGLCSQICHQLFCDEGLLVLEEFDRCSVGNLFIVALCLSKFVWIVLEILPAVCKVALMGRLLNFYLNLSNQLVCLIPGFVGKFLLGDLLVYKGNSVGCQWR